MKDSTKVPATAPNVLDPLDQLIFAAERATGASATVQCVWLYNRAVDIGGLRRFHECLQQGRLSRSIERSPLPFGRHRWVSSGKYTSELEVVAPQHRDEFEGWLRERACIFADCEREPGWHLAMLPFLDGGAAVCLVISHCLTDGGGLAQALVDAARGRGDLINWPAPRSRRWWRALSQDARQAVSDVPAMSRAFCAAIKLLWRDRVGSTTKSPDHSAGSAGQNSESVKVPKATAFVDAQQWDTRAELLGGTSNGLLIGVSARLAQRLGRVGPDGSVAVSVRVNERRADDTRANALGNVDITVDPTRATTDLSQIRAAAKQALLRHQQTPDERWELLPLVPLIPQWLLRRMIGVAAGAANSVVASNLGVLDPATNQPDGNPADYTVMHSLFPGVSKVMMDRAGGLLGLASGRVQGRLFVSVDAYQPGCVDSDKDLRQQLSRVLSDFSLSATMGWPHSDEHL